MRRANAFALPPQIPNQGPLTRGPSIFRPHLPRGAPHGRLHGPVDTRGLLPRVRVLCAICASRGPHAALPRGLSAASHPRGGPARHVSARLPARSPRVSSPPGPLATSTPTGKYPLFAIFYRQDLIKIRLKIK